MNYDDWLATVPAAFKGDALWTVTAYRLALFLGDIAWRDTRTIVRTPGTHSLADQLYRAVGSISANLAEGYSRGTGKDRARFYEYALGSARESRDWYFKARHLLSDPVFTHRLNFLTRIIQLLLIMIPQQRGRVLKEQEVGYEAGWEKEDVPFGEGEG